jgi:DNA modification methylase
MEISYALGYDPTEDVPTQMDVINPSSIIVVEVPVNSIRSRIRLRKPKEDKIIELADSIKISGLIHPITIDTENYLICGYHRWFAFKHLKLDTIPAIIKDVSNVHKELIEISENISRSELDHLEISQHIVRREELLEQLGMRMKKGGNQYSTGLITTTELASNLGMSNRIYRLKRQPAALHPEVMDELIGTEWAQVLMDMVKLSREPEHIQQRVSTLLVTGKCRTFKRAYATASVECYRNENEYKVDFDLKERWGIPQSIMRFKKGDVALQKICDLVSKDEELEWNKRAGLNFGQSRIPVYGMAADLAEFLITYYTPENGIVLDQFSGRFTIGMAALHHGRRFVGYDLNPKNVEKAREVINNQICSDPSRYTLHTGDCIPLKEYEGKSEYFDAIVTDPPYVLNAERYSENEYEIGNLPHEEYLKRIKLNLQRCYDLIKTSSFDDKLFFPIIFKTGTGRRGKKGIIDMDYEFQKIAKEVGLVLWDKLTNQLHSPFACVSWERNYINKYVMKNYEISLVFVKF